MPEHELHETTPTGPTSGDPNSHVIYVRELPANNGYLHVEAFCLMMYVSNDGGEVEYVWNSRDGVTPYAITSRRGTELRHARWRLDQRIVDFRPQPGSRVFVNITPEVARPKVEAYVARYWDDPLFWMIQTFSSREQAIEEILVEWTQPGLPTLTVVGADGTW